MKEKKLKDLRKGDRMWVKDFTSTTPIVVKKKVRQGGMVTVTLQWDDSELECYGPALGWTCISYNRHFGYEEIFTTKFEEAQKNTVKNMRLLAISKELYEIIYPNNK